MKTNYLIIAIFLLISTNSFSLNNKKFLNKFNRFKAPATSKSYKIKRPKTSAELFLDDILKNKKSIKTLYIKAKVDILKKFIRVKGEMEIYMVFPNKILIKTSVLGFNISTLLINGNKLYFKDNVKNTLKIRRATNRNISRHIPIRLSLKQFKLMLKGAPPVINFNKISINKEKRKLSLRGYKKVQYLEFNKNKEIKEMSLFEKGKKRINIKFSKIKTQDNYSYASRIVFKDYKKEIKSKLHINQIEFNKKIKLSLFKALK